MDDVEIRKPRKVTRTRFPSVFAKSCSPVRPKATARPVGFFGGVGLDQVGVHVDDVATVALDRVFEDEPGDVPASLG